MRQSIFILLVSVFFYSCKQAQQAKPLKDFSSNQIKKLDGYIDKVFSTSYTPGISVVVLFKDSVYIHSVGIADEQKDSLNINMPFSAGSISEPVLATAVMKLVEAGKLNLDDPVVKYLPYFKMGDKINRSVTVRHLLSHTSGVQHYDVMWDMPNNTPGALEVTTKSISSQQAKFPVPGSRVSRSPYNYDILADLISKVSGKAFEDVVKETVFKPLGMENSSFIKPVKTTMPFSVKNWLALSTVQDSLYPYNRENGGSNGFHTTPKDFSKWMYMLLNSGLTVKGKFIDASAFNRFFALQYNTGEHTGVGFGWEIKREEGAEIYSKVSQISNFSTQVTLIPEDKIGIAVFSNIGKDFSTNTITQNVLGWLKGGSLEVPKTPVWMAMSKKMDQTGSLDSAFAIYKTLKQNKAATYDCSEYALNQFGIHLLRHHPNKQNAVAVFKFSTNEYPKSALGYLNLAEVYMKNKELNNASLALIKAKALQNNTNKDRLNFLENHLDEMSRDPDPG